MFKVNRSIKRFMAYMLVVIMSFSILSPVLAEETDTNPESGFVFSDGVITGYTGTATDIVIPEEIDGETVTEIAAKAFAKKGLTSVTFPNTLEKIGKQAFAQNELTSVDFPESVKIIDAGSFLVNSISKVNFKQGLEEIGDNAFARCPIEEVTIPGSVKQIGMRAFSNGGQLKELDIQEGVEYVGRFAFEKNVLTSVTIPDSVTNIDDAAFKENSISEVKLGDGLERIGNQAFASNEIQSIIIPNGLKTLARHAFEGNPGFEEDRRFKLYLKEPVKDINEIELEAFCSTERVGLSWEKTEDTENGYRKYLGHFKDFTNEDGSQTSNVIDTANQNLKKMEVIANVLENKPEEPVADGDWNSKHFTFEGTTVTGFSESGQKKFEEDKEVVIPEKTTEGKTVDSIGDKAFNLDSFGEDGIKSLTLPETIKTIGSMAFRNNNIVNLELPDSVEELGNAAFTSNRDLETLKLSSNLKTIPNAAFSFSKIEKLVIPEGLTEIGGSAFSENKSLSDLTISSTVEKIGSRAFWGVSITELTIPGNVKEIGSDAFFTGKLSSLTLEEGIETIGRRAFKSNNLTEVTIPKSVIKLDKTAFDENKGINIKYASLIEILEEAQKVETEGKTEESIKALQEAIEAGKIINAKSVATLEEVNTAVESITNAINGLEGKPAIDENQQEVKEAIGKVTDLELGEATVENIKSEIEKVVGEDITVEVEAVEGEEGKYQVTLIKGEAKEEKTITVTKKAPNTFIVTFKLTPEDSKVEVKKGETVVEPIDKVYKLEAGEYSYTVAKEGYVTKTDNFTVGEKDQTLEVTLEKVVVDEKVWVAEDFEYDGTTLIGFSESGKAKFENNKDLIIPQKNKEGELITVIGTGAFWNDTHAEDKDKIKSLELPDTIEKIEARAFGGNLIKNLQIPKNVKSIGDGAFLSNQIEHIVINEGLESIGRLSFGNNELTEVTIPSSMKKLGQRAFFNNKISKLKILPGIERLGAQCFENNVIQELDIPETVKYLDLGAFVYNSLENVKLPESIKIVGPKSLAVNNLESVTFPESVEWFCPNSFRKNKGFESGEFKIFIDKTIEIDGDIKESVLKDKLNEEIKVRAAVFEGLIDEPKHKIDIKSWERVGEEDGYLIYRGKFEEVPVDKIKCGSGTSCENTVENMQMTSLIVKVKLTGELLEPEEPAEPIEPEEPEKPEDPEEPVEPEEPIKEAWDARYFTFEGTTLTGLSELGQKKFATDKEVVIPEKTTEGKIVDSIGDGAFNLDSFGEDGIKSLTLPETIKSIGAIAFRNNNIVHLELPDSVEELGNGVFASNRDLETLKLSNNLKTIPQGAFSFSKIEKLVIPEGVVEIGGSAFSENKSLSDLTISSTVEKIGSGAFWNAVMVELTIPGNVKEIGQDAFTGGKLSSLTLEEGIETIGKRTFKRNKLTEVTIPKSVIKLDKSAFDRNPDVNIKYASLIEILEEAEKVNTEGKTEESIKVLQEAIEAGKTINAKPDATLEEVNTVVKEIQVAIDVVEDKSSKPIIIEDIKKTKIDDKIEITISAFAQEDISGILILKPIDENERAYKVICKPQNFVNGENEIKIELKSSDYLKGIKEIKAYIWDSLENMKPLADVKIGA